MKACAAASPIPLKANTDEALEKAPGVTDVIVVRRTGGNVEMKDQAATAGITRKRRRCQPIARPKR